MQDFKELSLIICTYQRPRELERLLHAIAEQTSLPDETLIVDASADEDTEHVVRSFLTATATDQPGIVPNLRYVRVGPEHRGLTRQRNYGFAHANGRFIAFLDDDTVPEPDYFEQTLACFQRHPEAVGVGGFISNEVEWWRPKDRDGVGRIRSSVFRWSDWERREAYRWRLRKVLGLASEAPPGWIPKSGHGRPVGYLPPDGGDYRVEFLMGCSFAFRREVFKHNEFSTHFEGYGLYEDMDFCVRVARHSPLYLCTGARLAHYHAPAGRPNTFRYGQMVVRNGWFVWRRRWPHPTLAGRARWWATTGLLTACQLGEVVRGPRRWQQFAEALGRVSGMTTVLFNEAKDLNEPHSERVATGKL